MDLVAGVKRDIVLMEHNSKAGEAKSKRACTLPLTRQGVVGMIVTDLCVFERPTKGERFHLVELAPGITADEVRAKTEADYDVALTPAGGLGSRTQPAFLHEAVL